MSLSYEQAVDELVRLFNERWNALTPAVLGRDEPAPVQWPGNPAVGPSVVQPFGRFMYRHLPDPRHTLAPAGSRRFTRSGYVLVQCFGPIADPNWTTPGLSLAEKLAIIARDAYEGRGTKDGLWFRNASIAEVGADKVYYQQHARIDFTYDERK